MTPSTIVALKRLAELDEIHYPHGKRKFHSAVFLGKGIATALRKIENDGHVDIERRYVNHFRYRITAAGMEVIASP